MRLSSVAPMLFLCDVPCSGLGVIAKKPDIRYKDKADVMSLPDVQSAILSSSAEYVKPGGVLVYLDLHSAARRK